MKKNVYKVLGAAAALSMLGFTAVPAFAEEGGPGVVDKTASAEVESAAKVPQLPADSGNNTITVTKLSGDGTEKDPGNGRQLSVLPEGKTKLGGVKFALKNLVPASGVLNLATNDGWAQVAKLQEALKGKPLNEGSIKAAGWQFGDVNNTVTTSSESAEQGTGKFTGLKYGVYLLTETSSTAVKDGETVPVTPAAPSLIVLPLTKQDTEGNTEWLTDVYVYPKNMVQTASKEVRDFDFVNAAKAKWPEGVFGSKVAELNPGAVPGSPIFYRIGGSIPTVPKGQKLVYLGVQDTLDNSMVDMQSADSVKVYLYNPSTGDFGQPLEQANYAVYATKDSSSQTETVTVLLTAAGLKAAAAAPAGSQLMVFFGVTVKGDANGILANGGEKTPAKVISQLAPENDPGYPGITPNTPGEEEEPGVPNIPFVDGEPPVPTTDGGRPPATDVPTPKTETKFGSVTFKKLTADGSYLHNAKFALYWCAAMDPSDPNTGLIKDNIVTASEDITITGLQFSNYKNGAEDLETFKTSPEYCLVETEAPTGYELLPEPIKFNITQESGNQITGLKFSNDVNEIINVPHNGGFNLPITGANGLILLSVAGGLLIAGGVVFAVARRRREEA